MTKYLTPKNIILAVVSVACIIMLVNGFWKSPTAGLNTVRVQELEKRNDELQKQITGLESLAKSQAITNQENRRADSVLLANYEKRIWQDYQVIQQLKNTRDENIKRIDHPSFTSDSIRRAFAELERYVPTKD